MGIKNLFIVIFCLFFIFACAERKIYMPEGKVEGEMPKKEEKTEAEKPTGQEELSATEMSEVLKKLQEEIKDIHFDFDRYDIRQEDIPTLKKVASLLQKYSNLRVIIEGHCDERGTNEYNFALGQKRANAVKQYLITLGVLPSKMEIISYGEEKPLCTEHNESCWQKNRRAHFVFIEEGK
ncbi:peptidoglycan-associated lipoprotein Pal [Thermodesulfovibrio sp. 3907-1M]|uniref:Peptidoglycan-associated lipoprotein n=1 Tax=Thermodesulfovibrio autotrophicus TaxID=3118333 RepID=A0AAU8GYG1_9BACT